MMRVHAAAAVVVVVVCVLQAAAVSEVILNKKVGDTVVLQPGTSTTGTITSVLWKHNDNLAMQLDKGEIDGYRQFETRGSLSNSSGEMTITGLTRGDSGVYTVEINSLISTVRLNVLSPVPKPTILKTCNKEGSICVLTCGGNITGAEPVTYEWRSGDTLLPDNTREKEITKENSLSLDKFSCELVNPVSRESSQVITNPITTPLPDTTAAMSNLKISTGLTVFISMISVVLLLVFIHRWKAGAWFFQKESMPWEADFWRSESRNDATREAVESNGTARQEKEQTDEETPMT